MTISRTTSATAALLAAALLLPGCSGGKSKPTPSNFLEGLNKHFLDHNDCLLPNTRFPYETTNPTETKQLDSLVHAGLLEKTEAKAIHTSRYTIASAGTRYAPRFCYGHREASAIDGFTPMAPANGFNESTVSYRYTMMDVPVWAKSADVQAAFPELARSTSGNASDKATMAQTPVGWQVPD